MAGPPAPAGVEKASEELARTLARFGAKARIERDGGVRVKALLKGLVVVAHVSRDALSAETAAREAVESGLVDVAVAVWPGKDCRPGGPGLDAAAITPGGGLEPLRCVDAGAVASLVKAASELLAGGSPGGWDALWRAIRVFVEALRSADRDGSLIRRLASALKAHGDPRAGGSAAVDAAVHTALAGALYALTHRGAQGFQPPEPPEVEELARVMDRLASMGYEGLARPAAEVLRSLPSSLHDHSRALAATGARLALRGGPLDVPGSLHGSAPLRKGLATFYTEAPASHMLAYLAADALLGLDGEGIESLDAASARRLAGRMASFRAVDFACGSGTLLAATLRTLSRLSAALSVYHGIGEPDPKVLSRVLAEEGLYCLEAEAGAARLAALNIALSGGADPRKVRVYTVRLGYYSGRAWLGSLELLRGGGEGLLEPVTGERGSRLPSSFDLVIMNPPFARATGRPGRFGGERGLFGFIGDPGARRALLRSYEELRRRVRSELLSIALEGLGRLPPMAREILERGPRQYLDIGHAGEALLFLHLAYKTVSDGGVIAFVLPRSLLAGVSWFLARVLLALEFDVRYVVASGDPEGGYGFSEGSSLSEVLLVARRSGRPLGYTIFINLLRKPSTPLRAVMLAEEARRAARSLEPGGSMEVRVSGSRAVVLKVPRRLMLESIDNWNRFVAAPDPALVELVVHRLMGRGELELRA